MWLHQEISSICIKEFKLRHQLDIIQDSAYVYFNLNKLIGIAVESSKETGVRWEYLASQCNFFWYNIIGYLKLFPLVAKSLDQKNFLTFETTILRKDNYLEILRSRIKSCRHLLEICRTISYRAQLKTVIARIPSNQDLFSYLSFLCATSDPPGDKLLAIDNRIAFIQDWTVKLICKHKNTLQLPQIPRTLHPLVPETLESTKLSQSTSNSTTSIPTPFQNRRVVSIVKPFVKFTREKTCPRRLSDLLDIESDSSCSSSESIWSAPFKKHKYQFG